MNEIKEIITYYSQPDIVYDNNIDIIKDKSLTSKEIDKNFNTLEGRSIKDVNLSEDGRVLIITLLNDKIFKCPISLQDPITSLEYKYNEETGELYIIINNDKSNPVVIPGFLTKDTVKGMINNKQVYTDSSLEGNGLNSNPLRLSKGQKTGMLKPINKIVEVLPQAPEIGERFLIKEKLNKKGSLYNYKGLNNIIKHLENTKWKVATKEDWDDMLNALEDNPTNRNHNSKKCNIFLGERAGASLINNDYNFNTVLCGYANEEKEKHITYEDERTIWWTSTDINGFSGFTKRVDKNESGVYQDISEGVNFYSVRLIRDVDNTYNLTSEEIMGTTYNTVMMPSLKDGNRVWIDVNFTSELQDITEMKTKTTTDTSCTGKVITTTITEPEIIEKADDEINRFTPEEWLNESQDIYYICEWNGVNWKKYELNNYDTFYLIENEDFYFLKDTEILSIHYKIENLLKTFGLHLHSEIIDGIIENTIKHEYQDYTYYGNFTKTTVDHLFSYTISKNVENYEINMFNDINILLKALYEVGNINKLQYNNVDYTWNNSLEELNGSKYTSDNTKDGNLLISIMKNYNDNSDLFLSEGLNLIINNIIIIFKVTII
jgi:uncharacterized protein (TIGR02145 family)